MLDANTKSTKLKVVCVQMDSKLECPDENYDHAEEMIIQAIEEQPDVIVLPECFENYGKLKERLAEICSRDGDKVKARICLLNSL